MSRAPERSESAGSAPAGSTPRQSTDARPTVLFVCEHGSARSAMAAALLQAEMDDEVRVLSAGPDPDPTMNPLAMAALDEAGVAGPAVPPTQLTDTLLRKADLVVSINRGCPPDRRIPATLAGVADTGANG